ncbi:MAG: class I SAM-dependent methyltransferase [Verrucomicrobiae bacterium]|nr:class I SAM-dependent methyltransferase [Verrucomicrobiae bacterium]
MNTAEVINKTMEPEDLRSDRAQAVVEELNALIRLLQGRGQRISAWYGTFGLTGEPDSPEQLNRGYGYRPLPDAADDRNFPWFLYWEIVWVVLHNEFRPGQRLLDLGGSSSLFSYYLASKGLDVTTVDLKQELVDNANAVARAMGWRLANRVMDMRALRFDAPFDHITSICVYEHIPISARVEINRRIRDSLVAGGKFSITFDYRNPSRAARIGSPQEVHEQFVKPSGLVVRGNPTFVDTGTNWLLHPFYSPRVSWGYRWRQIKKGHFPARQFLATKRENDYTFGALFLEKG